MIYKKGCNKYQLKMRTCPDCGQWCKVPHEYRAQMKNGKQTEKFVADSYCKRCKKKVELFVEFI